MSDDLENEPEKWLIYAYQQGPNYLYVYSDGTIVAGGPEPPRFEDTLLCLKPLTQAES